MMHNLVLGFRFLIEIILKLEVESILEYKEASYALSCARVENTTYIVL